MTIRPSPTDPQNYGEYVQVDRVGNPLTVEALIPLPMKDYWNRSLPAFDQQFAQFIGNPFFATGILNGVYKVPVPPAPRAAKGEYKAAIASYEKAQASTPMPDYAAALYDLYTIQKDPKNAQRQRDMIDVIDKINKNNGEVTNRNLALIFADHDWHLDRALELATAELDVRKDIYSYDALAWALYKNKKFAEADGAMAKALRMGTPEPAFYYHAEQIASRYANRFISIVVSSAGSPDDGPELDRRAAK